MARGFLLCNIMFSSLKKIFVLLSFQPVNRSATAASYRGLQQRYSVSYVQAPVFYTQKPNYYGPVSLLSHIT